jgi:hypothetical protein
VVQGPKLSLFFFFLWPLGVVKPPLFFQFFF